MMPVDAMQRVTPKQRAAVRALLTARTLADAAHAAGVGHRTLARWMTQPAFRDALSQAEGAVLDGISRRLLGLADEATDVLQARMSDATTPATQLRATTAALDFALRLRELQSVEARLARLEDALLGGTI